MTAVSDSCPALLSPAARTALEMYRRMHLIRRFEQRAADLYRDSAVPGFVHLSIGQEASAVGACWHLDVCDAITSTHRGHGHCLAKGLDAESMFAELMAKETGACRGRGGSMHIADPQLGIYGANGIVGAGLPIAVGAATARQLHGEQAVVVAFFGDGAVAQGFFHEAVNLAAVWDLPIVFFCENNGYAEFSSAAEQHPVPLATRALGYGLPFHQVDGNDVIAVADVMGDVIAGIRAGGGPVVVEAQTYRWHGHYEGDPQAYRDPGELESWKSRDPLVLSRNHLQSLGVATEVVDGIDRSVEQEIEDAVAAAGKANEPSPETLLDFVIAARDLVPEPQSPDPGQADTFKTMHAVRDAIAYELDHDPAVYLAGIDVAAGGNVFALFRGLADQFPGRVRDTPISESALIGSAVGAAMSGMRPVVELMYLDFVGVAFDQLLNQAAKMRFMTGGAASLPLVVRTQFGAGRSSGSQHSQSLEALLAHIPGLTVVMPSNPAETYGLLRAAIRDPNPVVFIENRLQYGLRGPRPPQDYLVPIGKARVVRPGSDVTVVSYSRMLGEALAAADLVAADGIDAEVIDLRTIVPLDRATVLESLSRTNRLVIVHEAVQDFGVGAEIAAMAANEGFWYLDAPVVRIAPPAMPAPYAPQLEKAWLPDRMTVAAALRRIVAI